MPKTYSDMPDEATERLAHLIKLFHPELFEIKLRVDLISVTTDNEDAPALTHQGYRAAAVVRVLGPKERLKGRGDAEIVVDEAGYLTMSDATKDALLDHELYHIEVKRNKYGRVKLDEHGRPKIQLIAARKIWRHVQICPENPSP